MVQQSVDAFVKVINGPAGVVVGVYLTLHVIDKFAFWVVKWRNKKNGAAPHLRCIECAEAKSAIENNRKTLDTLKRNEGHLNTISSKTIEMVTILRGIEKNGK